MLDKEDKFSWGGLLSPVRNKTYAVLLYHTPIWILPHAIRTCTGTTGRRDTEGNDKEFGPEDRKLISNRCLKQGEQYDPLDPPHESVLEHISYTFELVFSRAVLQELARTRIGISLSVESTRFALKKIVDGLLPDDLGEISKLIHITTNSDVDLDSARQIGRVIKYKGDKVRNDVAKYGLPECFMTRAIVTLNICSMRRLFALRTSKRALAEYRQLCFSMLTCIPKSHRFLFEDRIHFETAPKEFLEAWGAPQDLVDNAEPSGVSSLYDKTGQGPKQ